jgi:hypothetical protein
MATDNCNAGAALKAQEAMAWQAGEAVASLQQKLAEAEETIKQGDAITQVRHIGRQGLLLPFLA